MEECEESISRHVYAVASESAFSAGWHVLDEKRSRMTDETVEMLLCFKDWLDVEARLQDKEGHNMRSDDEDSTNSSTDN